MGTLLVAVAARCSRQVSPYGPLRPNVTSSLNLEVHNISQRRQTRTEPRPQGIGTPIFVEIGPAVPEICSRIDRQTDGLITIGYSAPPTGPGQSNNSGISTRSCPPLCHRGDFKLATIYYLKFKKKKNWKCQ